MSNILPFLREAVFDPETTKVMSEAFDMACLALAGHGDIARLQQDLAKRIIQHAQYGERDPARLCDAALSALGFDRKTGWPGRTAS